jgi:hypothetical protein
MNSVPRIDILEATRLTRQGRLEEATALLRAALSTAPCRRVQVRARRKAETG